MSKWHKKGSNIGFDSALIDSINPKTIDTLKFSQHKGVKGSRFKSIKLSDWLIKRLTIKSVINFLCNFMVLSNEKQNINVNMWKESN